LDHGPVRFLLILTKLAAHHPRPLTRRCKGVPHFRRFDQFLHIAQPLGPAVKISTRQRSDATAFPSAEIRRAIRSAAEDVIEIEAAGAIRATATALVAATLLWCVATVCELPAIPLSGLVIAVTGTALTLPALLSLAGLLTLPTLLSLLTRLCRLLLGTLLTAGLLAAGLLATGLLPAWLLTTLLPLLSRLLALPALILRVVARDLL
jgi:hypothetical protein